MSSLKAEKVGDLARRVAQARHLHGLPRALAVGPLAGKLASPLAPAPDDLPELQVRGLGRMPLAKNGNAVVEDVLEGVAGGVRELSVHVLHLALGIGDHHGHRGLLDRARELVELLLRDPLAGDVVTHGARSDGVPAFIEQRRLLPGDPAPSLRRKPSSVAAGAVRCLLELRVGDRHHAHIVDVHERGHGPAGQVRRIAAKLARESLICGEHMPLPVTAIHQRGTAGGRAEQNLRLRERGSSRDRLAAHDRHAPMHIGAGTGDLS